MKTFNLLIIGALITSVFSCKPIYKCGDTKPVKKAFFRPKIYQQVINERDSLCTTNSEKASEIALLLQDTAKLKNDLRNLQNDFDQVRGEKKSQAQLFNQNLKQKSEELRVQSEELKAKEKLLAEREKALKEMRAIIARQDSVTKRLNNVLRNALLNFKSDELSVEIKDGKVYVSMSDKLLFKSGSATVETKGSEAIRALADVLSKNQDIDVLIEGHTDSNPIKTAIYNDNWDLSTARAISIVRILTNDYRIAPTRVIASGRAEFAPRATNSTAEGRAKNRRTEIILTPKLNELMNLLKTNQTK